jgi:hypothetical protein
MDGIRYPGVTTQFRRSWGSAGAECGGKAITSGGESPTPHTVRDPGLRTSLSVRVPGLRTPHTVRVPLR